MIESRYWLTRARAVAWYYNLGWWLRMALPGLLVINIGASVVLICWLTLSTWSLTGFWQGYGCVLLLGVLATWWRVRPQFESPAQALVRMESALHLHNRLTMAAAGSLPWPPPQPVPFLWRWEGRAILAPLVTLLVLPLLLLVPRPGPDKKPVYSAIQQPQAWTELATTLEKVKQSELFDEENLKSWENKVEQLTTQKQDKWLSQSSLEATQALKTDLQTALARQQSQLAEASSMLQMAALQPPGDISQQPLSNDVQKLLSELQEGSLPIDPKMAKEMAAAMKQNTITLSEDEAKALADRLQQASEQLSQMPMMDNSNLPSVRVEKKPIGSGGVERGPGTAPLLIDPDGQTVALQQKAGLDSQDRDEVSIGDTVSQSVQTGEELPATLSVERGFDGGHGSSAGGPVNAQPATPEEQQILKRYFPNNP